MKADLPVEPPSGLDPLIAQFVAELARAAVRREKRQAARVTAADLPDASTE
jgi:hypothetical protein